MAITAPGSGPNLIRDAHYHAVKATASWATFMAQMTAAAKDSATARQRNVAREKRATDYARDTLGRH